jgi:lysophospholipase L1-like esterase
MKFKPKFKKLLFSVIFTLVLLAIAELVLSTLELFPTTYFTATPNSGFTWEIDRTKITGIYQDSEVKFDDLGARTISDIANKSHKIAAFGGSTTACFALTQSKTWTALLEKKLGPSYWVGNFGRPGNSSNHNVEQIKHILNKPKLKDVETILIMQGANDFVGYLISPERYLNSSKQTINKIAFQHQPEIKLNFPKNLSLYKLASRVKTKIIFYFKFKDHLTKSAIDIKSLRRESKLIDSLPALEMGLNHFEKNIISMINWAKKEKKTIVFTTQATMWKPGLERKYEELIMTSGFQNNESFYSTKAFSEGMNLFNERLISICKTYNVPCINLNLPKTTQSFYDDFHFNESGAKLVSNEIYTYLSKNHLIDN